MHSDLVDFIAERMICIAIREKIKNLRYAKYQLSLARLHFAPVILTKDM